MQDAAGKTLSDTVRGLVRVHEHTVQALNSHANQHDLPVLPHTAELQDARHSLTALLPQAGSGTEETTTHLLSIAQGFNASSLSSHYYGFVTGGVTPAARIADSLVTLYDQNVAVHLPNDTIATDVEKQALAMLTQLFGLPDHNDNPDVSPDWKIRILTTGATASNVLGLISAREYLTSTQNSGLLHAAKQSNPIERVKVLTTMGHSSLKKAANIAGIGANNVVDVAASDGISFDLAKLTAELAEPGHRSIVSVSCGEVNTGAFATHSESEMRNLRLLCDQYKAWLHVDGAFGLFAACLPDEPRYARLRNGAAGLHYADSVGGDGHKLLNVPYDCGFFFARAVEPSYAAFQNGNAPYLTAPGVQPWDSPLNVGLENSRRFRALPVYATLHAYGRQGYADIVSRCVDLSRALASWVRSSREYELLGAYDEAGDAVLEDVFIIVLFKARDALLNDELVRRINATRRMYVSATQWRGRGACRLAVSNWQVDVQRDAAYVVKVLQDVYAEWASQGQGAESKK